MRIQEHPHDLGKLQGQSRGRNGVAVRSPPTFSSIDRFGVLLCFSAVLEQIPQLSARTAAFCLALVCYLSAAIVEMRVYFKSTLSDIFLLGFLGAVILSGFWAIAGNSVSVADAARGAIPFLFLSTFFLVDRSHPRLIPKLASYLGLSAAIWMVSILVEGLYLFWTGEFVAAARLTSQVYQSVIPFGLVALPFLVLGTLRWSWMAKFGLVLAVFLLTLLAGYRSQMLLMGFQFFVFAGLSIRDRAKFFGILFSAAILTFSSIFFFPNLVESLLGRFESTSVEFESSRLAEWRYALERFGENPFFGKGIGWQVPFEVTFDGALEELLAGGVDLASSAGYLHSVSAYLLMDMGIVGFILYYATMIFAIVVGLRKLRSDNGEVESRMGVICAAVSMVTLLLFFQVQASFRLIQSNLLLTCLLLILLSPYVQGRSAGNAQFEYGQRHG